jgi:hypothetical protein
MRSSLIASAQHDMAFHDRAFHDMAFHEKSSDERSHAPAEPSRLVTSGQDEVPSWRERSVPQPLASSTPSESERSITLEVFRNAWTRVAAVVRGKRDAASKPRHADAMLQIDAGPLKW